MKNFTNLGFVILLLVILGCSCPKLNELIKQAKSDSPSPTPFSSNTSTTPANSSSTPSTDSAADLDITLEKYNQITTKMRRADVEKIVGGKGTEVYNQEGGGHNFTTVKYEGSKFKTIIIVYEDNTVMSKSQYGLQ